MYYNVYIIYYNIYIAIVDITKCYYVIEYYNNYYLSLFYVENQKIAV